MEKSLRARALSDGRVRRIVVGLALATLFTTLIPRAAEASTIVVRPNDLSGWSLSNQNYNVGNVAPVGAFVSGPNVSPLGYGSLEQTVPQGDKQAIITSNHNGETLASLTTLKYDTFTNDASNQRPALKLQVDIDGDGQRDNTLVYEPLYQTQQPQASVWQVWDATAGLWWPTVGTWELKTLADWDDAFGGTAAIATLVADGISVESGSTGTAWVDNYVAFVDCIVVGADAYDLEPIIVTETSPSDWVLNDNQNIVVDNKIPSGAFVTGPAAPPAGYGSFAQTVYTGDKQGVYTPAFNGSALTALRPLSYSTFTTRTESPILLPAMKLGVDTDNDNDRDTTLVFEAIYNSAQQTPAANEWQTWDAANGLWWSTANVAAGYKTLADWNATFGGQSKIAVLTHDGIRIESGSTGTSWPDSVQNFDNVRIVSATYDFESLVPPAPVFTSPIANSVINTTSVSITGTSIKHATVEVFEGDDAIGTATADGLGNWTLPHTFSTGSHTLTAVATDYVGNEGDESTGHTFSIDTTAPSVPVFQSPAAGATVATGNVTVNGYAEPGTTITLKEAAAAIGTGTTTPSSTWSIPVSFTDGPHSITATATDAAGNVSVTSGARTFTVNAGLPAVPAIIAPAAGSNLKTSAVTVSGTAQAGVTVTVKEAGAAIGTATADLDGIWSMPLTFADGPHSLKAFATNLNGDSAESIARAFAVDTVAPDAPAITSPAADGDKLTSQSVTVSGTAERNTFVVLKEGVASRGTVRANAAGAWSIKTTLTDGEHTLTATSRDVAGNVGGSSTRSFSIDSVKPTLTFTTPNPAIFAPGSAVVIGGTAKDASGVAGVSVEFFDFLTGDLVATVEATLTPAGAGFTWSAQPEALTVGLYDVVATVTDSYGNKKSGAITIINANI